MHMCISSFTSNKILNLKRRLQRQVTMTRHLRKTNTHAWTSQATVEHHITWVTLRWVRHSSFLDLGRLAYQLLQLPRLTRVVLETATQAHSHDLADALIRYHDTYRQLLVRTTFLKSDEYAQASPKKSSSRMNARTRQPVSPMWTEPEFKGEREWYR